MTLLNAVLGVVDPEETGLIAALGLLQAPLRLKQQPPVTTQQRKKVGRSEVQCLPLLREVLKSHLLGICVHLDESLN
jgi:hypothetical protein